MALHEEGQLDVEFGDYANHDFATYHVATCANVGRIEVDWLDEQDDQVNPMGTKGHRRFGRGDRERGVACHRRTGT